MKKRLFAAIVGISMLTSLVPQTNIKAVRKNDAIVLQQDPKNREHATGLPESEVETYARDCAALSQSQSNTDNYCMDNALRKRVMTRSLETENDLPSHVDNSKTKYFPPVGDQGKIGSCQSWAQAYYQATYALNRYYDQAANENNIMSPYYDYAYGSITSTGGLSIKDVPIDHFYYQSEIEDYPVDLKLSVDDQYKVRENRIVYHSINLYGYDEETPITGPKDTNLLPAKQKLNEGYLLNISVFASWFNYDTIHRSNKAPGNDKYNGEKIIVADVGNRNTDGGSHAMTVVGYDDDIWVDINKDGDVQSGELGAFKLVNSWGDGWANDGFVWLAYDALNKKSDLYNINSDDTYSRVNLLEYAGYMTKSEASYEPKAYALVTLKSDRRDCMDILLETKDKYGQNMLIDRFYVNRNYGACNFTGGIGTEEITVLLTCDMLDYWGSSLLENYESITDLAPLMTFRNELNDHTYTVKDIKFVDHTREKTYRTNISDFTVSSQEVTVSIDTTNILPTITSFEASAKQVELGEFVTLTTNVVDTKGNVQYRYIIRDDDGNNQIISETDNNTITFTPDRGNGMF